MLFLVIQELCIKKPISDVSRKQRLFLFLEQVNTKEVSEKSKDIILELNCDAPMRGVDIKCTCL